MHESLRKTNLLVELPAEHPAPPVAGDASERLLTVLDSCLRMLPDGDRELIVEYYRGEQREKIEHRRALAARFGVSINALTIRACRLRNRLEAAMKARLGNV